MNTQKITIIDYGMGNLLSIARAVKYTGAQPEITDNAQKIATAEKVILPGVGAFGKGIERLKQEGLLEATLKFVAKGRPILGICLGMQLFLSESYEFGVHQGLGIIAGIVKKLQYNLDNIDYKIPQIGWNCIYQPKNIIHLNGKIAVWENTILRCIESGSYFYFVHSYACYPDNPNYILAETEYGSNRFCSVINKDNIWGCQFHPEKSAANGLNLYHNFVFNT